MIYDCFTFYNELELLDIRLNVLDKFVDKFVLVESTITYTNQKKPLYYQKNRALFKKFQHKIIHVVVADSPRVSHPWIIEQYLMAATERGLKNAKQNDTILISNLDEIPKPEKILEWSKKPGKIKVFEQNFFYYYLNFVCTNKKWLGTKLISFKNFKTYYNAYVIRHSPNNAVIKNGGWHFSHMGGINRIQMKLATGSHQEYNNANYNTKEKILKAILKKRDIFGHGDKFDFAHDNSLPTYLLENRKKYSNMFLNKNRREYSKNKYILETKHRLRLLYRMLRNMLKNIK